MICMTLFVQCTAQRVLSLCATVAVKGICVSHLYLGEAAGNSSEKRSAGKETEQLVEVDSSSQLVLRGS